MPGTTARVVSSNGTASSRSGTCESLLRGEREKRDRSDDDPPDHESFSCHFLAFPAGRGSQSINGKGHSDIG